MSRIIRSAAVAIAACLVASQASAINVTMTSGPESIEPGAVAFADFDGLANLAIGTVTGGVPNDGLHPTDGTPYTPSNFLSADNGADVTVTFTNPVEYFGMFVGSTDRYNILKLYSGATLVSTLTMQVDPDSPFKGIAPYQVNAYMNFFADSDALFTSAVLTSGHAFETDNYTARAAVPIPAALPLLVSGLGALGVAFRRRRRAA